ncbi:uncharacterized protein LOC142327475 [Lycorma delicatula]|uniref:uncharacterized protein LOC142327475 n=1 Tax=Lycorma delicatula TaxID=130591 RepID=UPI003F514A0C
MNEYALSSKPNVDNNDSKKEEQSVRRRRSSFIDKSRILFKDSDDVKNCMMESQENSAFFSDNDSDSEGTPWKQKYLDQLKEEHKDWENLLWNTKFKYEEANKKAKKTQLLDNSSMKLLNQEEIDFLNETSVYKRLAQKTDILIELVAINSKNKLMAFEAANEYLKYKNSDLKCEVSKLYKKFIEEPII